MRLLILLAALAVGLHTQAHQQKEAYTTVLFNTRSGNLEVSHRFYIHDAEHALRLLGKPADLLADENSRARFSDYVRDHFQLRDGDGGRLALHSVGHQVEGKYFWVYQEMPIPAAVKVIQVKMRALQEVWPRQINHINVDKDKRIRSVRLSAVDSWKTLAVE